jgi:hypothetical protein
LVFSCPTFNIISYPPMINLYILREKHGPGDAYVILGRVSRLCMKTSSQSHSERQHRYGYEL